MKGYVEYNLHVRIAEILTNFAPHQSFHACEDNEVGLNDES